MLWRTFTALISRMGTKTTFICDCCLREADNNLGWARIHINGASGDKQLMPDENRRPLGDFWGPVCTENLIRVDDVMESPKLAE